jgi:methylmalonyl-CoA mutase
MEKDKAGKFTLAGEFPPVSTEQWEEKIREDLKGADYEKELIWETVDGQKIRPYYRREDLGGINYLESLPGQFPYLRGAASADNSWLIRQDLRVKDPATANAEAKEMIERGAGSVGFDISGKGSLPQKELNVLLDGLSPNRLPIHFILDENHAGILDRLHAWLTENGLDPRRVAGSISLNPLGRLAATGNFRKNLSADLSGLGECLDFVRENLPVFRVLDNNGAIFHNGGASITQELAFTLSMGNEYLVELKGMEYSVEQILPHMQFGFASGSSYFMEIAKLRAARYLWSRILESYTEKAEDLPPMYIRSSTSGWNQTLYDPHVNMLRGITAAMSAILGGTDELTVTGFDRTSGEAGEFSRRVARNTQVILKEESYLDKVIDPAAGSYYIESLTDTLISDAWEMFLEIEEKGGFRKALAEGYLQAKIVTTAKTRLDGYATRKAMLLGTNQFPIGDEKAGIDPAKLEGGSVSVPEDWKPLPRDQRILDPVKAFRGAGAFEQLRLRTENHPGGVPVVFIIPLGNLAMRRARAMFTMNFFGCAGFRVIDNIGKFKTVSEGTAAAREAGTGIVVLCSSDDEYPPMAEEFASEAGKDMIPVVAGYPKKHIRDLRAAGIEHFIHLRSNVLEELSTYQELLGIRTGT